MTTYCGRRDIRYLTVDKEGQVQVACLGSCLLVHHSSKHHGTHPYLRLALKLFTVMELQPD